MQSFFFSGSIYQVYPGGPGFVLCFTPIILFSQSLQQERGDVICITVEASEAQGLSGCSGYQLW